MLSMSFDEPRHPFICQLPSLPNLGAKKRSILVYLSGFLFAIGWWLFIDSIVHFSQNSKEDFYPYVEDYAPGIVSTIGMLVVNLLDPSLMSGDTFTYSGSNLAWQARLCFFIGITANAGALFGSITLAVLKYYLSDQTNLQFIGTNIIFQNVLILISCIILWIAQSTDENGIYNIVLN